MSKSEMAREEGISVAGSSPQARVLVQGEQTAGRLALVELVESQGGGPPRHLHHWEDEVFYVLEGEVTFQKGDALLSASAGSCILLPRGCEHTWRVDSSDAKLLVTVAPAGLETSYRELSWGDAPIERVVTMAARYGVEVTGPPLGS